jgi:hypothetical protein
MDNETRDNLNLLNITTTICLNLEIGVYVITLKNSWHLFKGHLQCKINLSFFENTFSLKQRRKCITCTFDLRNYFRFWPFWGILDTSLGFYFNKSLIRIVDENLIFASENCVLQMNPSYCRIQVNIETILNVCIIRKPLSYSLQYYL